MDTNTQNIVTTNSAALTEGERDELVFALDHMAEVAYETGQDASGVDRLTDIINVACKLGVVPSSYTVRWEARVEDLKGILDEQALVAEDQFGSLVAEAEESMGVNINAEGRTDASVRLANIVGIGTFADEEKLIVARGVVATILAERAKRPIGA